MGTALIWIVASFTYQVVILAVDRGMKILGVKSRYI